MEDIEKQTRTPEKMIEIIKTYFHDTHFILNFKQWKSDCLERKYAAFFTYEKKLVDYKFSLQTMLKNFITSITKYFLLDVHFWLVSPSVCVFYKTLLY
jgi:hypothetical protein